jgi:hypothetical protein
MYLRPFTAEAQSTQRLRREKRGAVKEKDGVNNSLFFSLLFYSSLAISPLLSLRCLRMLCASALT